MPGANLQKACDFAGVLQALEGQHVLVCGLLEQLVQHAMVVVTHGEKEGRHGEREMLE